MTARKYVDIGCDICQDWAEGDAKTVQGARRNVRRYYGWRYLKVNGRMMDLCSACACDVKDGKVAIQKDDSTTD